MSEGTPIFSVVLTVIEVLDRHLPSCHQVVNRLVRLAVEITTEHQRHGTSVLMVTEHSVTYVDSANFHA